MSQSTFNLMEEQEIQSFIGKRRSQFVYLRRSLLSDLNELGKVLQCGTVKIIHDMGKLIRVVFLNTSISSPFFFHTEVFPFWRDERFLGDDIFLGDRIFI